MRNENLYPECSRKQKNALEILGNNIRSENWRRSLQKSLC